MSPLPKWLQELNRVSSRLAEVLKAPNLDLDGLSDSLLLDSFLRFSKVMEVQSQTTREMVYRVNYLLASAQEMRRFAFVGRGPRPLAPPSYIDDALRTIFRRK